MVNKRGKNKSSPLSLIIKLKYMGIMLGNFQLKDIVEDKYIEKIEKFLKENGYRREVKCDSVKNKIGNYHIYDVPRVMVICGEEKMQEFIDFLKKEDLVGKGFKGRVGVSYI